MFNDNSPSMFNSGKLLTGELACGEEGEQKKKKTRAPGRPPDLASFLTAYWYCKKLVIFWLRA